MELADVDAMHSTMDEAFGATTLLFAELPTTFAN
jgi:hypothetical protein